MDYQIGLKDVVNDEGTDEEGDDDDAEDQARCHGEGVPVGWRPPNLATSPTINPAVWLSPGSLIKLVIIHIKNIF